MPARVEGGPPGQASQWRGIIAASSQSARSRCASDGRGNPGPCRSRQGSRTLERPCRSIALELGVLRIAGLQGPGELKGLRGSSSRSQTRARLFLAMLVSPSSRCSETYHPYPGYSLVNAAISTAPVLPPEESSTSKLRRSARTETGNICMRLASGRSKGPSFVPSSVTTSKLVIWPVLPIVRVQKPIAVRS